MTVLCIVHVAELGRSKNLGMGRVEPCFFGGGNGCQLWRRVDLLLPDH